VIRLAILPLLLVSAAPAPQGGGGRPTPGAAEVDDQEHDGAVARTALPPTMHHRNTAGVDGSGNCVFASIAHTAKAQGIDGLDDFHLWMQRHPGGGWPEKVDRMIAEKLGPDHGIDYVHVYGPESLPIIERAVANGYLVCVTLGYSDRPEYQGEAMGHMVNIAHLGPDLAAVHDNNAPGDYEWMSRAEFEARASWSPRGPDQLWAMIFLDGQPLPPEPATP
jgi:hypothetical protein